jgi:mutator protein MutT
MTTILHITKRESWSKAQTEGIYRADTLVAEGFIHCSRPDQALKVANSLFLGQKGLVLLYIDEDRVAAEVRYENLEGGDDLFPHIYGPLNLDAIIGVASFEPDADGGFELPWREMKQGVDYIGVGVGAVIVDDQGRLFLSQRGPKAKNERGLWEFPGGSVEFGETLAEALKREMREEYGIEVETGELLDVVDHILREEGQHWVSPTFVCRIVSGEAEIQEAEKCSEIGWFSLDEIPSELSQVSRINLKHYRERIGQVGKE